MLKLFIRKIKSLRMTVTILNFSQHLAPDYLIQFSQAPVIRGVLEI